MTAPSIDLAELRASIAAEEKRMERRPVPTEPWIMPLGLTQLLALVDAVEAAQAVLDYENAPSRSSLSALRTALAPFEAQP